jgi:hypothetical protein
MMSSKSPTLRGEAINARDHQHVALAEEVEDGGNSSRPAVLVPLRFSARIVSQPQARGAASWSDRS